jgi:hypothetical protein
MVSASQRRWSAIGETDRRIRRVALDHHPEAALHGYDITATFPA